jgi:hypothetical protein
MATKTADRAADSFPVYAGKSGSVCVAYGVYEVATQLSAGPPKDVIEFCKVPAGAVILGGWFMGDDIDTGTEALDISIGDSGSATRFLTATNIQGDAITDLKPTVGIMFPLQGTLMTDGPYTCTSETTIIGTVDGTSNAGHTGTLSVVVYYVMA